MEKDFTGILTNIRLFSDFKIDEISWITEKMTIRKIAYDTTIFNEGELGSEFFIILSGQVQVSKKDTNNKEHEIARLGKGSCFGEMALVDTMPRSASIHTMDETNLAILTQDSLSRLKEEHTEIYSHVLLNLAKEFSRRLRNMDEKYIKIMGFFF